MCFNDYVHFPDIKHMPMPNMHTRWMNKSTHPNCLDSNVNKEAKETPANKEKLTISDELIAKINQWYVTNEPNMQEFDIIEGSTKCNLSTKQTNGHTPLVAISRTNNEIPRRPNHRADDSKSIFIDVVDEAQLPALSMIANGRKITGAVGPLHQGMNSCQKVAAYPEIATVSRLPAKMVNGGRRKVVERDELPCREPMNNHNNNVTMPLSNGAIREIPRRPKQFSHDSTMGASIEIVDEVGLPAPSIIDCTRKIVGNVGPLYRGMNSHEEVNPNNNITMLMSNDTARDNARGANQFGHDMGTISKVKRPNYGMNENINSTSIRPAAYNKNNNAALSYEQNSQQERKQPPTQQSKACGSNQTSAKRMPHIPSGYEAQVERFVQDQRAPDHYARAQGIGRGRLLNRQIHK